MAPEIWLAREKYGAPVDMWAVGVLSYIILVGYPPFHDESAMRLKAKVTRCQYQFHSPYWDDISEKARDFVSKLLVANMRDRMTVDQALAHPWVGELSLFPSFLRQLSYVGHPPLVLLIFYFFSRQLLVKSEDLNIHHLSSSIVQLKSFNARRRLRASAKAVSGVHLFIM
jgi:serine/threonine protein kinase